MGMATVTKVGLRKTASNVSMTIDAWTAVDIMADEDGISGNEMLQRLVSQEAKRRLDAKKALQDVEVAVGAKKTKQQLNLSPEERERRSVHAKKLNAERKRKKLLEEQVRSILESSEVGGS